MIEVDGLSGIQIDTRGDQSKKMLMLGAIKVAERVIQDLLMKEINVTVKKAPVQNDTLQQEKTKHNDGIQVSKDKAVDFYLEFRNKIDQRLNAISKCDKRMTFILPDIIDL